VLSETSMWSQKGHNDFIT